MKQTIGKSNIYPVSINSSYVSNSATFAAVDNAFSKHVVNSKQHFQYLDTACDNILK